MQRVRKLAALLLLLPLLLAGCAEQSPASTPPVDAETFLRELYGDRLVIEDGRYYYQWYAGENFLLRAYEADWRQPLQADEQNRNYRGWIEENSVSIDVTATQMCYPGQFPQGRLFVAQRLQVSMENHTDYALCFASSYLDIQLGENWYTLYQEPSTARLMHYAPLPQTAEFACLFSRFDDPYMEQVLQNGRYRLTIGLDVYEKASEQDGLPLALGTYAVATEFDVRNGEVVRD